MRVFLILTFCGIVMISIGCNSNKVPVGIHSCFIMQPEHVWHEEISSVFIDSYEKCCFREELPIYLHRVIQDNRGWTIYIGAGEGTSKEDIAKTLQHIAERQHLISKTVLDEWSWNTTNDTKVIRYAYDEPDSGILITLDFLIHSYSSLPNAKTLIEADLYSCLKFR